jgi:hypothetical protein
VLDGAHEIAGERVALSGYSGGGFSVTQALQANASEVDELYAMDLAGFTGGTALRERATIHRPAPAAPPSPWAA